MKDNIRFNTKTIHGGQQPDPAYGAVMPPIYQTSTYAQATPGDHKGFEYSRTHNPTRNALQDAIASLENGKHGLAFASGMAATDTIIKLLKPNDEVISVNDLYGGSYRIFTKVFSPLGIDFKFIDVENVDSLKATISDKTKMVWIETPTNPMLNIIDIQEISNVAKQHGALVVVDNTFASPYLQQPLELDADIVMHSATKYLGGHSDTIMGLAVTNNDDIAERLAFIQNSCGAIPGPFDSFMCLRGIKTLHVRMQRHCENAHKVAHFLKKHDKIKNVYWPGFEDHPNHHIAKKQMKDFGGMLSFTLKDEKIDTAIAVLEKLQIFTLAESLGGVESLVGHPASMTHASIPREERIKSGVSDGLIRLSVGIEDEQDLLDDLSQALG